MFFKVLGPIYHSPITIESLTYRVLPGTLAYGQAPALCTEKSNRSDPRLQRLAEFGQSFAGTNLPSRSGCY